MKKFKTRKKYKKIKIIALIVFFIILFIVISFHQLKESHLNLSKILLHNFKNDQNRYILSSLTSNVDNLFNSYSFNNETTIFNETKPIVYLYNTHSDEKYQNNVTIQEATLSFENNLNKLGISVINEKRLTTDYITSGLSYYDISKRFIKENMEKESNIAYYIDIHRDSVTDTTIKINNKYYAKIMFVLGLENKNYLENKAVMLKMNDYLNNHYPGISRGIYEKKGKGVDGIYNQDISSSVILIEIGGVNNNFEEVNNSTEILSLMLYHMLGD